MHYFYFIYTDYYFEAKYKVYGKDFLFYLKSYNVYCVEAKYKVYAQSIHILFYVCSQQGDWSTGSVYGQLYYQCNRR